MSGTASRPNDGIIHHTDLLILTNQLWHAGAQAIAINRQRIGFKTGILCAGPIILINGVRVASPFTFEIYGKNPQHIYSEITKPANYLNYLSQFNIKSELELRTVHLPAVNE
jgi:uncharacterized protein YlxW (UPF0749 family)